MNVLASFSAGQSDHSLQERMQLYARFFNVAVNNVPGGGIGSTNLATKLSNNGALGSLGTIDSGELRLRLDHLRVEEVIAETVDAFRARVEQAGIHLSVEMRGETPPIEADGQRLSRVLYNLLQNALRHTPSDGTITLRTSTSAEGVEVAVIDTGEGIAAEDLPHVFDRFYRGEKSRSRERGGSGLGLAIARGIVEAHGGRIWAEANPGGGTIFRFTLPVEPA